MFITACIVTALSVPMLLFFKDQPEHFPSYSAKNQTNTKFNFKYELKELSSNKNYRWINICFMCMYGVYTCLGAIINDLVSKFGFSSTDSSIMGACFIMSGLVGSFVFSGQLDKHQKYLLQLRIVCFTTLFLFSFSFLTLPTGSLLLVSLNISVVGFFLLPIIPLGFGFSIELTYPVSEAMSNGVLMLFSQIVGSIVTFLGSYLCSVHPFSCLALFFGMMMTASIATLLIEEDLRRLKMTRSAMSSMISSNK